ncbi:MAG: DUF4142 domain-containing protein [Candidatus Velthaea sp.]
MKHTFVRGMSALVVAAGLGSASVGALAQQAQPVPQPSSRPNPNGQTVPAPPSGVTAPGGPGTATQAPGTPSGNAGADGTPVSDADFVRLFADVGNSEVVLARYMLRTTQNPVVRNFAQQMIDDHQTGNVELRSTVRANGDRYAAPLDRVARATVPELARLQALSGPQLDRAYMQMQVGMHRRALAMLQWEASNGKDAALKSFAASQLPAISAHAQMASAYAASNGASTVVDSAGTLLGGSAPGMRMPPNAPNGTVGNNPGVRSNGSTSGTDNGSGGTAAGNPLTNKQGQPTLTQSTPQPLPTGAYASPMPSPAASASPRASASPSASSAPSSTSPPLVPASPSPSPSP